MIQIFTEKFAVDLGKCLRWGKLPTPFLWPEMDVIRLKNTWLKCSRVLCVWDNTVTICCVLCG